MDQFKYCWRFGDVDVGDEKDMIIKLRHEMWKQQEV